STVATTRASATGSTTTHSTPSSRHSTQRAATIAIRQTDHLASQNSPCPMTAPRSSGLCFPASPTRAPNTVGLSSSLTGQVLHEPHRSGADPRGRISSRPAPGLPGAAPGNAAADGARGGPSRSAVEGERKGGAHALAVVWTLKGVAQTLER